LRRVAEENPHQAGKLRDEERGKRKKKNRKIRARVFRIRFCLADGLKIRHAVI